MRLIGKLENEKQAFVFYSFLLEEGIHSTYEKVHDEQENKDVVTIWIYEEDEIERAQLYLQDFKQNPGDAKYTKVQFPTAPPQPPDLIAEEKEGKKKKSIPTEKLRKKRTYPITYLVIFLCVLLFLWNIMEQITMLKQDGVIARQIGMTPLQQVFMFDYPTSNQKIDALLKEYSLKDYKELKAIPSNELAQFKSAEQIPTWRGSLSLVLRYFGKIPKSEPVDGPMFEKIREGEVWRLFTPCLLHGGLLHILFNMAWVWLLMRQVEERLSIWKLLIFILVVGIVANLAQYLVSGPYFLGFSGVVVGLVAFIWARQKLAPWEGYPLNRTTFIFILIFIGAMFALEIFSLLTALIFAKEISANIANTAHIIGGVAGYFLGRMPFFARGAK
ncbi:MAG: Rhomboid protease GlpG [Chlamydiae bacterium]|nr:Rhomboid protease GlpG [Chlamydiota bacterium]